MNIILMRKMISTSKLEIVMALDKIKVKKKYVILISKSNYKAKLTAMITMNLM